jgi:putative tricarboxylic transport membrane protein
LSVESPPRRRHVERRNFAQVSKTRAQIAYWQNQFAKLFENPEWKATFAKHGWENEYMNSRDFSEFLDSERKELAAEFAALGVVEAMTLAGRS